jgi:glycosyltransferase involved in cell wall biosynthesis
VRSVHVVVPDGIDDPARPSGGNTYDRHVCRELTELGWSVHEHAVTGFWTWPESAALATLAGVVDRIPDGAAVLFDGLIASKASEVLVPQANRLRLVVLVHMPLGARPHEPAAQTQEGAILSAAVAIVTTSAWARRRLLELYRLPAGRLHVAKPGAEPADLAPGTESGGALLCVAAVTYDKGHDVLLEALARIGDLDWNCSCVGSLDRDPAFVQQLRRRSQDGALAPRLDFLGPLTGADLDRAYRAADLMVLASRAETYGMVVTEALAHGVPVLAADVGGLTEALGHGADGIRPGLLVSPADPAELAAGLRSWLGDAELRARLRRAARQRRESLSGWSTTASVIANVLTRCRDER